MAQNPLGTKKEKTLSLKVLILKDITAEFYEEHRAVISVVVKLLGAKEGEHQTTISGESLA